jgi:hypothetical protein
MKILIAYDGSEGAESAIDDLKRAGLPRSAEAIVLTITEELFPAPTSIGGVATTFGKDLLEKEKESLALARRAQGLRGDTLQWPAPVRPSACVQTRALSSKNRALRRPSEIRSGRGQ